jgi:DNA-binding MarR family transcriptional regulator
MVAMARRNARHAERDEREAFPDPGHDVRAPRNVLYALFVASQRSRELLALAMRDAPIRPDEYGVYSAVFAAGSLTQTQLARSTGMPLTTVADYVRAMVERGHVERRPNPTDRRSVLLSLSPTGEATVRSIMPAFSQAVRTLIDELPLPAEEVLAALEAMALATERTTQRLSAEGGTGAAVARPR